MIRAARRREEPFRSKRLDGMSREARGARMPRFFFHIRDSDGLVEDPEGIECRDPSAIRDEAVGAARDLMADHIRKGFDVSGWSYEVVDERGRPILTLRFAEAVRRI